MALVKVANEFRAVGRLAYSAHHMDGLLGVFPTARSLVNAVQSRQMSVLEVVESHLDRIDQANPTLNAIVAMRSAEEIRDEAKAMDVELAASPAVGADRPLLGLPMAIKDLADAKGLPTRSGSKLTGVEPLGRDSLFVSRIRAAGAIIIGKTNTPEFGAGSNTFNEVYGATLNPHDPTRTAGGSSGGAAAALASGMLPIADGSDLGGSLRNPAGFNGVFGLRPSIGRVPRVPKTSGFIIDLPVAGPMARNAGDLGLLLSVMAGDDPRDPRSLTEDPSVFAEPLGEDLDGLRVAWGGDLGLTGNETMPFESDQLSVARGALQRLVDRGAIVDEAAPDLRGAMATFRAMRALGFRAHVDDYPRWETMKPTLVENIRIGLDLSIDEVMQAEDRRTQIHAEMLSFFDRYDVLAMPTTQVGPFPVEVEYPTEINGQPMGDYLEWMSSCCVITVTGCPAVSVPAGVDDDGLPVGLQLISPPRTERRLLEVADAF